MPVIDKTQKYIENYNKEHYKKIYMQIPKDFLPEVLKMKDNYGSYPKLLEAGINAINEVAILKNEIDNFRKNPVTSTNWEEKYKKLQREFEKYKNENNLKSENGNRIWLEFVKIIISVVIAFIFAFFLFQYKI